MPNKSQLKTKSETAFEWSLSYLDKWSISKQGLKYKLLSKGFQQSEIDIAIHKLVNLNLIDDIIYAENLINNLLIKYYAKPYIKKKLLSKYIPYQIIYLAFCKINMSQYEKQLFNFIKYNSLKGLSPETIYRKALLRGWSKDTILEQLQGV
ncbi:MAG: RecX family transcriptional regulator [Bifidobacteriaceae bacterium]|jgi:SOS response regulatory protein OraA/RecX|nr:RecX family transcriptional regulator [Bifidobacteriaceae bacterium]